MRKNGNRTVLFQFFFWSLKKVCYQTEILGGLFTSSSPCRKDQFAVSYFSICKHGCDVKMFCLLRADHASTNLKKFMS